MECLAQLESQLQSLATFSKASMRLLDTMTDTTASIEARTKRIRDDVQPWELAQEHITATIEELSKAARSYQTPYFVPQVLSRKVKDPILVCRAIDHLVYANEYISNKPSNTYGDKLEVTMGDKLKQVATIANDTILSAFVQATGKFGVASTDLRTPSKGRQLLRGTQTPKPRHRSARSGAYVVHTEAPLRDIDTLVKKVYESFDSRETVEHDVRQLLQEKMTEVMDAMFDAAYLEEAEGPKDPSATHANLVSLSKHYQSGDHRILSISEACREMVGEVANCIQTFILTPLDDDYAVAPMPAELATVVFNQVLLRAIAAIRYDTKSMGDSTRMFVASRGAGVGLCPAGNTIGRHFRDCLFIGLDVVPELWKWQDVAKALPGERDEMVDLVQESVTGYLDLVRQGLDVYADAKGTIEKNALLRATKDLASAEWMPSLDCTVHESTTNLLHLLRTLFTAYFGALKLVLHGGGGEAISVEDEVVALEEVLRFVRQCVEGNMSDLATIGDAAMQLQEHQGDAFSLKSVAAKAMSKHQKEMCRMDPRLFLINNASFLLEHLSKEPCFTCRTMMQSQPEPSAVEHGKRHKDDASRDDDADDGHASSASDNSHRPTQPVVAVPETRLLEDVENYLRELRDDCVEGYCDSWMDHFPSTEEDDILSSVVSSRLDDDVPLTKEQRMSVKQWYGSVAKALQKRIDQGSVHVVMDSAIRSALLEGTATRVQEQFEAMEDALNGREWSKHPLKWSKYDDAQWIDALQKLF